MTIKFLVAAVALFVITFQSVKAQSLAPTRDSVTTIAGKWAGTFDGSSNGKF